MKTRIFSITLLALSACTAAKANQVAIETTKPIDVTFRIAHKNQGEKTVFGELQSMRVDSKVTIPVDLAGYKLAGIVPISVNGHELPPSANEFDRPNQCSITTDKTKSTGYFLFEVNSKKMLCKTKGGIFG